MHKQDSIQHPRLNLGCGTHRLDDWTNIDYMPHPAVDLVCDLDRCAESPLPFENDCIEEIVASHFLEHISHPLPLLQELHRVAKPDAIAQFMTPYGSTDDAFEDPTHVRQMFLGSWAYFSQPIYWRADYGYRGDWQPELVRLTIPSRQNLGKSDEEVMHLINTQRNVVMEMTAYLRCVKPIRENKRELIVPPQIEICRVDMQ